MYFRLTISQKKDIQKYGCHELETKNYKKIETVVPATFFSDNVEDQMRRILNINRCNSQSEVQGLYEDMIKEGEKEFNKLTLHSISHDDHRIYFRFEDKPLESFANNTFYKKSGRALLLIDEEQIRLGACPVFHYYMIRFISLMIFCVCGYTISLPFLAIWYYDQ